MKIGVSAVSGSLDAQVDPIFGRCAYFVMVNPDTMEFEAIVNERKMPQRVQPKIDADLCIGCGQCVNACPAKAIRIQEKKASIDLTKCKGCGACMQVCSQGAIKSINEAPHPTTFTNRKVSRFTIRRGGHKIKKRGRRKRGYRR